MDKVASSNVRTFDKFVKTLKKCWEGITNYFLERESSGFVEGLNNKLKVIKRQSYGINNVQNFFRRIYLSLEGYALFA